MLWLLLLAWVALGLAVACLFGKTADTMREGHGHREPAPAKEGYSENLLA